MAELFVGAVVPILLEKLASVGVSQFLKLVKGNTLDPKTIQRWEKNLKMIGALLIDAEQRLNESHAVKLWLEDLQDLAYDLEDILDDFATEAQLHQLQKTRKDDDDDNDSATKIRTSRFLDSAKHKVKSFLACVPSVGPQFQYSAGDLSSRIKEINRRFQEIQSQAGNLGLSPITMNQATYTTEALDKSSRQTTYLVCEPSVYGRDDIRDKIVETLLKDGPSYENVVVIPIVGMGGIGKTTLAQYIYNDEQLLKGHFDLKAWVCVSDVFDVTRVTTEIINSFTNGNQTFSNLNQAQEKLVTVLEGKKFFMVLDDIWSENYNHWNQLQTPFRQGLKGSRVIVTTRKDITARMVIDNPTHSTAINLKGLSDDDCWCIFQQHATEDPDLADMQNDIMEKCKGLPLAAKALGGLLKSTVDKSQRRNILKSDIWSEESNVLPALRLSYQHLPSHLKCVFAYCSLFPKDYIFKETEVISLWMAQGFIPENRKERMEDIGHGYFLDLVSRSLFEECLHGRGFTMHDLIHDLAQWAAGDLCSAMDTMYTQRDLKRTRHMFLRVNYMDETLGSQILASPLRTFLYYAFSSSNFFDDHGLRTKILIDVQKFQYLRALSVCLSIVEELPESIGDLKHLRFLKLRLAKIKVLPKSISKLCNLQTFDLRGCNYLEEVPHITYMVKLRHLYIEETSLKEMPLGIGRLIRLQTMDELVLAAGVGYRVSELRNLDHLRGKLSISGLENVTRVEDAQETKMDRKDGLDKFYLHWGTFPNEIDESTIRSVVEQLKPHTCIKKCVLNRYMGLRFPAWLGNPSFSSMVKIKLMNCWKCIYLPPLGQLPSLKKLKVEQMDSIKQVGPEFCGSPVCSIPFPALETLKFEGMQSWEKWLHSPVDNNRAFPCLETLVIKNCDSLEDVLPSNLASLKKLEIMGCKEMSVALPSLPLLEELTVLEVSQLSTTEADIFCSKKMFLGAIMNISGLLGRCSYLLEQLFLSSFDSVIIMDQIPRMLRRLDISECHELQSLVLEKSSSSFYCLEQLTVRYCKSIVSIGQVPSTLRSLEIRNCEKLQVVEFKDYPSSEDDLPALQTLKIIECKELNLSLPTLPLLEDFMVSECKVLSTTADVIFCLKRMYLGRISESICLPGCFPCLGEVTCMFKCQSLITIDQVPMPARELRIEFCQELQSLEFKNSSPFSFSCAGTFSISCCQSVSVIRQIPLTLQQLKIFRCEKLRVLEFERSPCSSCDDKDILRGGATHEAAYSSPSAVACSSVVGLKATNIAARLTKLTMIRCSSLISLQQGLLLPFVQELHFSRCENMEGLPSEMHKFTLLKELSISGCPKIHFFPEGGLPTNLKSLHIIEANIKQPVLEWGLHLLHFLEDLELINVGSSIDTVESIRGPDLLPSSLSELKMEGFPNLKSIYCSTLPNLTRIDIECCPKFESFGDNHLPSRLQDVNIQECDLIKQHLKSDPNGCIRFNFNLYSLR